MNLKNLSAYNKIHKKVLSHLNQKKIFKIFEEFSSILNAKKNLAVAVSGGPDSLALAYLAKCFSLLNNINVKYFIVDHKLRRESSLEAKEVRNILNKINVKSEILIWNGKKPLGNIQSLAREKRFSLLANECKKNNIEYLLIGHHINDLFENFLIRIVRGSGLNGLISFDYKTKYKSENLEIMRPLLNLEKKDLIYVCKKVFNFFVKDPSNINKDYKRTRIRNLLHTLEKEGLDKKKLLLTIKNLKDSDASIKFYVDRNLNKNAIFSKRRNSYILSQKFFDQSHEIIFRSLTKIIQNIGKKYYPARGKSIDNIIERIKEKSFSKLTLGGCYIDRVGETILISEEN